MNSDIAINIVLTTPHAEPHGECLRLSIDHHIVTETAADVFVARSPDLFRPDIDHQCHWLQFSIINIA